MRKAGEACIDLAKLILKLSTCNAHKRTIKFPRNTTFVVEEQEEK